jgi:hypothetical protein
MADQQQGPLFAAAAAPMAVRPSGPVKKSLVTKMAGAIASHAHASLALIIVLTVLLIGVYIYYHGLFFLGPYARPRKSRAAKKRKDDDDANQSAQEQKGDLETERLIDSINSR